MRISDWSSDVCSSDLLVLVLEIFDYEPELELHLRLQREVRRRGFVTSLELEPVGGAAAIEADGQQHERGVARDVRGVAVVPAQQPDREKEDIDALLLFEGLGVIPDVAEPLLQPFRGEAGLEAEIAVDRKSTRLNSSH